MDNNHILFIGGCPPKQGVGSPIIVDRHLKRLSSAYQVSIVAPEQTFINVTFPESWRLIRMPNRRWWWLPYRYTVPQLQKARFWCWRKECEKVLCHERPSIILTVLHDKYSVFSAYLSQYWQIPLITILHDQEELWAKSNKEYNWIRENWEFVINQSTKVLPVSIELSRAYNINCSNKVSKLVPIPEGSFNQLIKWRDEFKFSPTIAYAGSIYPSQISCFKKIATAMSKINGKFLLVTDSKKQGVLGLLDSHSNIEHQEPFPENMDVINYLANNASSIIVSYPLDLNIHPWCITCFPSKLVEFCHLGLPILIIAPTSTALGKWSLENNWLSYLSDMDDDKLLLTLSNMTKKEEWLQMANQSINVAKSEFNPELIQVQFEDAISIVTR
jgi:hypothetical protein